jgi:hypothetical protein
MTNKLIDYTLPEFVFLDGNSPEGDTLEERTVVLHVRTASVFEVIHIDNVVVSKMKFDVKQWDIQYINPLISYIEDIKILLHYTFAENDQLEEIILKLKEWYFNYLKWEDNNINE